jgi:anthranilate phosphoribosyltransferase
MRDIALLNGAAAIVVAEKARDLPAALGLARESVDSGKARGALEMLIDVSKQ